jgi:hypothetical protein
MFALFGCETSAPQIEPTNFRSQITASDQFISLEEEALAEQYDPDGLWVDADETMAATIIAGAKQLTNNYAELANPKVQAREIQRLVRDSLVADVLVVAEVVGKTQVNREVGDELWPWTVFDFEVTQVLAADEKEVSTFELEKLGGEIDGVVTRSCGMPDFALGQRYLVALQRVEEPRGLFLLDRDSAWMVDDGNILGTSLTVSQLQSAKEGW